MRHISMKLGIVALTLSLAAPALADPKPRGAKAPDAQSLANIYAGRSDEWTGCKGGIYYGGKWQAQALCTNKGDGLGVGTWSVDRKGRVCWKLDWYWQDGDGVGSKSVPTECIDHLVDANGTIWRSWKSSDAWWKLDTTVRKTFKLKRPVTRLRRKLGV